MGRMTDMQKFKHFGSAVDNFDDPSRRYIFKLSKNLILANASLLMLGDSGLRQIQVGMLCEAEREMLLQPVYGENMLHDITIPGVGTAAMKFQVVDKFKMEHVAILNKTILEILPYSKGFLLIINYGIWYNNQDEFERDMNILFEELLKVIVFLHSNKKKLVFVWAESTAQHWPENYNGYFTKQKSIEMWCNDIQNISFHEDWRNDYIWKMFLEGQWSQHVSLLNVTVGILPIRQLTVALADMHISHDYRDCTHYCYTPMMYQSLYHELVNLSAELLIN